MWFVFTCFIWLLISSFRWVMFATWMDDAPFSSHIYLASSMVAQLQTNIATAHVTMASARGASTSSVRGASTVYCTPRVRAIFTLVLAWLMFIWIMATSLATAIWFHSREDDIFGFLAGFACFGSLSSVWIRYLTAHTSAKTELLLLVA
mmetsp:Transcript_14974/g.28096  ORF Transcript_14974/g.28096 Transcript_14974/m.28096 type:complete len:149 (+) Transcript_14974:1-447(+)